MRARARPAALAGALATGLALCLTGTACGGSTRPASPVTLRSCMLQFRHARCGTLTVPENRLTGKGRAIPVRFVVLPAYGHHRAPDPVVDFAGGPGGSAVLDIPSVLPQLIGLNQDRDLIFIDQRGTGGSNGLTCPSPTAVPADLQLLRRGIESCLSSLRGRADLRFYTSAMAAEDVAQVLTALHYGRVNLFGGSYGATAAQVFQRMFPARVRTMTLLSGTLLGTPLYERFPRTSQQALDAVFARCGRDLACHEAFPRLDAEWPRLLALLARGPVSMPPVRTPIGTLGRLDGATLVAGVHAMLLSANTAVYLPLLIHSLFAANGRPAAIAAVVRHVADDRLLPDSGGQAVIGYPIRCAEPWASLRPADVSDPASYYYQASVRDARWWQYACTLIPAPGAAARYGAPGPSAVPVLMINGTADPQDPPANMSGARQLWPNGRLLSEPGQSHSIGLATWRQCDATLVRAFVEHADASGLDAACLARVALPAFPVHW